VLVSGSAAVALAADGDDDPARIPRTVPERPVNIR